MAENELVPWTTSLWLSDLAGKMELRKQKEPVHSGWSKQRECKSPEQSQREESKRNRSPSARSEMIRDACPFLVHLLNSCSSVTTTQMPPPL